MTTVSTFPRARWQPALDRLWPTWPDRVPPHATVNRITDHVHLRSHQLGRWTVDHPEAMVPARLAVYLAAAQAQASIVAARSLPGEPPLALLAECLAAWHDATCEMLDLLDPLTEDHDELTIADANHDLRGADHA